MKHDLADDHHVGIAPPKKKKASNKQAASVANLHGSMSVPVNLVSKGVRANSQSSVAAAADSPSVPNHVEHTPATPLSVHNEPCFGDG